MDRNYAEEMAYCEGDTDNVFKKLDKVIKDNYQGKKQTFVKKEVVYWELKDGKKIDIDTMSEQHLKNVLKLIVTKNLLKQKTT
jgi:hypothetical protein